MTNNQHKAMSVMMAAAVVFMSGGSAFGAPFRNPSKQTVSEPFYLQCKFNAETRYSRPVENSEHKDIDETYIFEVNLENKTINDIDFINTAFLMDQSNEVRLYATNKGSVYAGLTGFRDPIDGTDLVINRIDGSASISYFKEVTKNDSPECFSGDLDKMKNKWQCDPFVIASKSGTCQLVSPKF